MKNTKDFAMVVMEKKERLDILEILMERLSNLEDDVRKEWGSTGKTEQLTRWNKEVEETQPVWKDENGEKTFENTGIPFMTDVYDYIEKKEYEPRDLARLEAIEKIRETLASLA